MTQLPWELTSKAGPVAGPGTPAPPLAILALRRIAAMRPDLKRQKRAAEMAAKAARIAQEALDAARGGEVRHGA